MYSSSMWYPLSFFRANSKLFLKSCSCLYCSLRKRNDINAYSRNISVPVAIKCFPMSEFKSFACHVGLISISPSQTTGNIYATSLMNICFFKILFILLLAYHSILTILHSRPLKLYMHLNVLFRMAASSHVWLLSICNEATLDFEDRAQKKRIKCLL